MIVLMFSSLQSTPQQKRSHSDEDTKKIKIDTAGEELVDPLLASPISSPTLQFTFEGTRDKKTVTAQIGIQTPNTTFSLRLRGPIGEKATQATLVDLDGLANSVIADLGIIRFIWKPYKPDPRAAEGVFKEYKKYLMEEKGLTECEYEKLGIDSRSQLPKGFQKKYDKVINWGLPILYGLRFQIGREKFEYFEDSTFEEKALSRTNYAVMGLTGIFLPAKDLYMGFNYRYQVYHQVGKKREICLPLEEIEGALECRELPVGSPNRQLSHIGQLEIRKFYGNRFAINPKFTYDFNNKIVGLELPLYFLQSKTKGLNGGVTLGWRSDAKELIIRFFVGNILGLLPSKN